VPGYYKTHEELVQILQREMRRRTGAAGDPSPELDRVLKDRALSRSATAIGVATEMNKYGRPLPLPSGWFRPFL
jgi:hypothetical protein